MRNESWPRFGHIRWGKEPPSSARSSATSPDWYACAHASAANEWSRFCPANNCLEFVEHGTQRSTEPMPQDTPVPYGGASRREPAIPMINVLWITQGLGCDGDTVAMTAATQPSLEDLVLGAIPGLPKVNLYHPVLAYEQGGEAFLAAFRK